MLAWDLYLVLKVLIWGFGGCCRFLTGICHFDLDFDMVAGLWYNHDPNFCSIILILKVKRLSKSFKSWVRALEDAGGSWLWFGIFFIGYSHWSLIPLCSEFWLYILILTIQRKPMFFKSSFGALEYTGGFWLDVASWPRLGYGGWSLINPFSQFGLSILILKMQRTSMSFKSSIGALEDAGGSWLWFGTLILI